MVRPAATGYSPLRMCTSVPQMVVVVMRSSASLGPISGMGLSCSSILPGSTNTAAFIMAMGMFLVCRNIHSRPVGKAGDDAGQFLSRCAGVLRRRLPFVGGEVVVHRLAGPLQILALDVADTRLPEGGEHGSAVDERHDAELVLLVQAGEQLLEGILLLGARQVLSVGTVDLDELDVQVPERVEWIQRAAELAQGGTAAQRLEALHQHFGLLQVGDGVAF